MKQSHYYLTMDSNNPDKYTCTCGHVSEDFNEAMDHVMNPYHNRALAKWLDDCCYKFVCVLSATLAGAVVFFMVVTVATLILDL